MKQNFQGSISNNKSPHCQSTKNTLSVFLLKVRLETVTKVDNWSQTRDIPSVLSQGKGRLRVNSFRHLPASPNEGVNMWSGEPRVGVFLLFYYFPTTTSSGRASVGSVGRTIDSFLQTFAITFCTKMTWDRGCWHLNKPLSFHTSVPWSFHTPYSVYWGSRHKCSTLHTLSSPPDNIFGH